MPKGPIHNTFNEFIETELCNYKNTIEENFHASTMKDYKFLRVENDYVHTMNTQNSCDLGKIRKKRVKSKMESNTSSYQRIKAIMEFYP